MKSEFQAKFFFTQVSGVIVGLTLSLISLLGMKELWPEFIMKSHSNYFNATIIGFLFLAILIVTLVLWGKILVFSKILTVKEAEGYPWSKPWLDKNKD